MDTLITYRNHSEISEWEYQKTSSICIYVFIVRTLYILTNDIRLNDRSVLVTLLDSFQAQSIVQSSVLPVRKFRNYRFLLTNETSVYI